MQEKKRTKPRKVDFFHGDDWEALRLSSKGRSYQCIGRATKERLTKGQLAYRARRQKELGLPTRMDFRNGVGPVVKAVDRATDDIVDALLLRYLERNL